MDWWIVFVVLCLVVLGFVLVFCLGGGGGLFVFVSCGCCLLLDFCGFFFFF